MSGQMRQNGCVASESRHMTGMTVLPGTEMVLFWRMDHVEKIQVMMKLKDMAVAMAYVPWQNWKSLYKPEKGLQRGTIFEELDKPFRGIGGCCNGRA